jgi:hypothetical protein
LLILLSTVFSFSQIKVKADGSSIFGGLDSFSSVPPLNSTITLSSKGRNGIYIDGSNISSYGFVVSTNLRIGGQGHPFGVVNPIGNMIMPNGEVVSWTHQPVFYVTWNGTVYCKNVYNLSDSLRKENVETINNPLEKVLKLRGVTYNMKDLNAELNGKGARQLFSEEEEFTSLKEQHPEMTDELFDQLQEEKNRKQMGVIAQEVERVIPEVVRTTEDGTKTVAYAELIGLLIEAIKEQQEQIEDLKNEMDALILGNISAEDIFLTPANASNKDKEILKQCVLYQNTPNPFQAKTEIRYELPSQIKSAEIYIFNIQGKLLKRIPADHSGRVEIFGNDLSSGIYLYSLVADGYEVDTKRMILTN